MTDVARQNGLQEAFISRFGTRPIFRMAITDGRDPLEKAEQLRSDLRIEFAEPNYLAQTPEGRRGRSGWVIGGDAGTFATQWAPASLGFTAAHARNRGAGVTIAVLDNGVDPDHPALAGRLLPGFDFVDADDDPREEGIDGVDFGFGHGTHVAGLIALAAPEAKILPVRVLDPQGVGNIWVLAESLRYAIDPDGHPATNDGATVINLSLGTLRRTDLLEEIIALAACDDDDDDHCSATGGAIVVAAAGNGGDSVPQYPAAEAAARGKDCPCAAVLAMLR